jgi:hypothetical protein
MAQQRGGKASHEDSGLRIFAKAKRRGAESRHITPWFSFLGKRRADHIKIWDIGFSSIPPFP